MKRTTEYVPEPDSDDKNGSPLGTYLALVFEKKIAYSRFDPSPNLPQGSAA
jgi:hypothetical protein